MLHTAFVIIFVQYKLYHVPAETADYNYIKIDGCSLDANYHGI